MHEEPRIRLDMSELSVEMKSQDILNRFSLISSKTLIIIISLGHGLINFGALA